MFLHLLVYKFKEIFGKKWIIAWTLIFPLILGTAFYAGFGNLIKNDVSEFSPIRVALVTDDSSGSFSKMVRLLSEKTDKSDGGTSQMFYLTETNRDKAETLLNKGRITGIYYDDKNGKPSLSVSDSGIDQTILSEFLRTYINDEKVMVDMSTTGMAKETMAKVGAELANTENLSEVTFKAKPVSPYMQYFFSLLAMASMFSSWMSVIFMSHISAEKSSIGLRFECSPTHKIQAIAASTVVGITLEFFSNIIIVSYLRFGLGLYFGAPIGYVILITTLGGALGITSGLAISSLTAGNKTMDIVIPLAFSMTSSFLSGLMVGNMRQIVELYCPIINRINPSSVFTDALYVAGTYGINATYWRDVIVLIVMILLFMVVASIRLSRRSYDSI